MNAVIIAPLSFLAALTWPRYDWRDWTALGFIAAICVEVAQGVLLPERQPSFGDVVANTGGALAGAVILRGIRPRLRTSKSG
jgi:glycopeptide antibiotics resistance protein